MKDECSLMLGYAVGILMVQRFYIRPMLFSMLVEQCRGALHI